MSDIKSQISNLSAGFTLMELMIVVVLIGVVASFAIPNYQKSIRKSHEKDAALQLTALHAANMMYKANAGDYLVGSGLGKDEINSALKINLIENELTYQYTSSDGISFQATAAFNSDNPFVIEVDERPLEKDVNPCCASSGSSCLSLPQC